MKTVYLVYTMRWGDSHHTVDRAFANKATAELYCKAKEQAAKKRGDIFSEWYVESIDVE